MKNIVFDHANKIPKYKNDPNEYYFREIQYGLGNNIFKVSTFAFAMVLF